MLFEYLKYFFIYIIYSLNIWGDSIKKQNLNNIVVYYPSDKNDKDKLSVKMANIHATAIYNYIKELNCPVWQKDKIIDMIIECVKKSTLN